MIYVSYACMYGLFLYMYVWILLRCAVSLTITLDCWFTSLISCNVPLLMCSFPSYVFPQVSKGRTYSTFRVLEPFMHLPWLAVLVTPLLPTRTSFLPLCATVVKVILYDPLLGLPHQTIWGLVGTSYWGDPLTCWRVQHRQNLWRQKEGQMTS